MHFISLNSIDRQTNSLKNLSSDHRVCIFSYFPRLIHLVSVHGFSKALFLSLGVKLFNEEQITEWIISGLCKMFSFRGIAELLIPGDE